MRNAPVLFLATTWEFAKDSLVYNLTLWLAGIYVLDSQIFSSVRRNLLSSLFLFPFRALLSQCCLNIAFVAEQDIARS